LPPDTGWLAAVVVGVAPVVVDVELQPLYIRLVKRIRMRIRKTNFLI